MKIKLAHVPQPHDRQIRKFFAWMPITIGNTWYWMERLEVAEEYFAYDPYKNIAEGWRIQTVLDPHPLFNEVNTKFRQLYSQHEIP
jgi:hypothetical protein